MRRFVLVLALVLFAAWLVFPPRAAQALTEEEKRRLFLKAREEMRTTPPPPPVRATPKPKPKPKATSRATPRPTPRATPRSTPRPPSSPRPTATPRKAATPRPTPVPTPAPSPDGPKLQPFTGPKVDWRKSAQVVVQKSGLEEERGLAKAPPSRFGRRSRYLTREVRRAIDDAPVKRRRWRYIVVHNSGTKQGNAKIFDYYHRNTRKMQNGMAYHFVIGNGTSSGDGEIEIGSRWIRQINGGHVHSDYLNNISLGICLVGDYNRTEPTRRQIESLEELVRYLRIRVGKIDRDFAVVKAHKEMNPPRWPTDCPGNRFPYRWLSRQFR